MFLTFEDYLVLWAIFLFAFRKMPAVLYFIWGKVSPRMHVMNWFKQERLGLVTWQGVAGLSGFCS